MGKAKNLKKRINAYTQPQRLPIDKSQMVHQAAKVKFEVLNNELEALLIEAELIRLHQPQYNILLKDDKSPIYVYLSQSPYAAVELIRKRDLDTKNLKGTILGPYSSAYQLQEVLKIARKIFPWCDKAETRLRRLKKEKLSNATAFEHLSTFRQACFYHHLELCPGACVGRISPEDYQNNLEQLTLFLRGKKKSVVSNLQAKMKQLADDLQFEQAQIIKNKLDMIEAVTSQQYRLKPDLILPALHDSTQLNALDHLRRILANFGLISRQTQLNRLEGYDVSNIMGQDAAVSMVVFTKGSPDKSQYRLFNIRELKTPNDTQMLKQAIKRRQNHPEWGSPDLIVVDGGKGQVRAALTAWQGKEPVKEKEAVIGIVKNPDRIIVPVEQHRDQKTKRLKINYKIIKLPPDHPTLHLMQNIRDEAHRFAKKQHGRLRRKEFRK